jgi:hypothetical protein
VNDAQRNYPDPERCVSPAEDVWCWCSARTRSLKAWAAVTIVALSMFTFSSAALAAPPDGTPKSGASHNCVATTSGILFYRQVGIHLGERVRTFAPDGGQARYVQGALLSPC